MLRQAQHERLSSASTAVFRLIRDLQKLGLLVEVSGQLRGRAYVFDRYLSLFDS